MTDTSEDGPLLPEWEDFTARFPAVGDALAAARRGEDTSVRLGDALRCRMRVAADPDGPGGAIETIYHISCLDALDTALANAEFDGTPATSAVVDAAVSWVASALSRPGIDEWLSSTDDDAAAMARQLTDRIEVVALDDSAGSDGDHRPARMGVREVLPVTGSETWDDNDSGVYDALQVFTETIQFSQAPASLVRALAQAGARVVTCSECGEFLTDGYRDWPGIWFTLDEESGPFCGRAWPPHRHAPTAAPR